MKIGVLYYYCMVDTKDHIPRGKMSAKEREFRSKLTQWVSQRGLMRGTLQVRWKTCGKANCKCARGERHRSVYLIVSEEGRLRQLCVPKEWEERVRQWVGDYGRVKEWLEALSRLYWDKVQHRER